MTKCVKLPLDKSKFCIFFQSVLKLMISLYKGAWNPSFHQQSPFPTSIALWQRLEVQDVNKNIQIAHWMSPSAASWHVTIQDVTVKHDSFLTIVCHRNLYLNNCLRGQGNYNGPRDGGNLWRLHSRFHACTHSLNSTATTRRLYSSEYLL